MIRKYVSTLAVGALYALSPGSFADESLAEKYVSETAAQIARLEAERIRILRTPSREDDKALPLFEKTIGLLRKVGEMHKVISSQGPRIDEALNETWRRK